MPLDAAVIKPASVISWQPDLPRTTGDASGGLNRMLKQAARPDRIGANGEQNVGPPASRATELPHERGCGGANQSASLQLRGRDLLGGISAHARRAGGFLQPPTGRAKFIRAGRETRKLSL